MQAMLGLGVGIFFGILLATLFHMKSGPQSFDECFLADSRGRTATEISFLVRACNDKFPNRFRDVPKEPKILIPPQTFSPQ